MRRWCVIILVLIMGFSLAGCGFIRDALPGGEGPDPDSGANPDSSSEEEWLTVDGNFYVFSDACQVIATFKELEFTSFDGSAAVSIEVECTGTEALEGRDAWHYVCAGESDDREIYYELWFSLDGELIQAGELLAGQLQVSRDSDFLAQLNGDLTDWFFLDFLAAHGLFSEGPGGPGLLYTDPSVFATFGDEYVLNEIRTEDRNLGAGDVKVYHYDYSAPEFAVLEEIALVGDNYMFIQSNYTYEDGFFTELTVTKAIPF